MVVLMLSSENFSSFLKDGAHSDSRKNEQTDEILEILVNYLAIPKYRSTFFKPLEKNLRLVNTVISFSLENHILLKLIKKVYKYDLHGTLLNKIEAETTLKDKEENCNMLLTSFCLLIVLTTYCQSKNLEVFTRTLSFIEKLAGSGLSTTFSSKQLCCLEKCVQIIEKKLTCITTSFSREEIFKVKKIFKILESCNENFSETNINLSKQLSIVESLNIEPVQKTKIFNSSFLIESLKIISGKFDIETNKQVVYASYLLQSYGNEKKKMNHLNIDLSKSALKVASKRYTEATSYLVHLLTSEPINFDKAETVLDILLTDPVGLYDRKLLKKLVLFNNTLTSKLVKIKSKTTGNLLSLLKKTRQVFFDVCKKLPLASKLFLFEYGVQLAKELNVYVEIDSQLDLALPISNLFQSYKNSIINSLIKPTLSIDHADFQKVISIACLYPYETLSLILKTEIGNREQIDFSTNILMTLNGFLDLELPCGSNAFVEVCMKVGLHPTSSSPIKENFSNNDMYILDKIVKLLSSLFSKLIAANKTVKVKAIAHSIYYNHIKKLFDKILYCDNHTKNNFAIKCAVLLFNKFFKSKLVSFIDEMKDIILLTYITAKLVDSNEFENTLQSQILEITEFLIEEVKSKTVFSDRKRMESLLKWLSYCLESLQWTTQLCFIGLFNNKSLYQHKFPLPRSLLSICRLPTNCQFFTLDVVKQYPMTNWLLSTIQCPQVFPYTSWLEEEVKGKEQQISASFTIAMLQVLPDCSETQWMTTFHCVETLINNNLLVVDCDINILGHFPMSKDFNYIPTMLLIKFYVDLLHKPLIVHQKIFESTILPLIDDSFVNNWCIVLKECILKFRAQQIKEKRLSLIVFIYCFAIYTILDFFNVIKTYGVKETVLNPLFTLVKDLISGLKTFYETLSDDEDKSYVKQEISNYKESLNKLLISNKKLNELFLEIANKIEL